MCCQFFVSTCFTNSLNEFSFSLGLFSRYATTLTSLNLTKVAPWPLKTEKVPFSEGDFVINTIMDVQQLEILASFWSLGLHGYNS